MNEERRMGILANIFDVIKERINTYDGHLSIDEITDILSELQGELQPNFMALVDSDIEHLEEQIIAFKVA